MDNNRIVAISLFSGAGGLDVASFMAGVPVASSTDFDSDCIETLKMNDLYANSEIIQGDLHQIESRVFKDILDKTPHDKFIVIGGAPCQPFSKAGYWVGNNTRRGINDPRATLVDEYLRVVTDLHPDGFVFENVESLLHPTNKVIVDRFIEIITENGYSYKIVRANALDYGVSQRRKRLFIIGTTGTFKSNEPKKPTVLLRNVKQQAYCPMYLLVKLLRVLMAQNIWNPRKAQLAELIMTICAKFLPE